MRKYLLCLYLVFVLMSCKDIERDVSKVLSCNPPNLPQGSYVISRAYYQDDSLHIESYDWVDVYSLPIQCKERKRIRNGASEVNLHAFDSTLKYPEEETGGLRHILNNRGDTLWSCPDSIDDMKLVSPVFFLDKNNVFYDVENKPFEYELVIIDSTCKIAASFKIKDVWNNVGHSLNVDKYLLLGTKQGEKRTTLLIDRRGTYLEVPFPDSSLGWYSFGYYFSYPVLLLGDFDKKSGKALIKKYEIRDGSFHFVGYLPYELSYYDSFAGIVDYIFPCGEDACLHRKRMWWQAEKIRY